MPPPKIVLIDDDKFIRITTSKLLEHNGYEVYAASNGIDGVRLIREHKPDTVLLDLMMPELNGWEVLKEIRADKEIKAINVIIFTACGLRIPPEIQNMNLKFRVLNKPFYLQQLIDILQMESPENE